MSSAQRRLIYRRRRRTVFAAAGCLLVVGGVLAWSLSHGGSESERTMVAPLAIRRVTAGDCGPPSSLRDQVSELVMIGVDPADPVAAAAMLRANPHLGGVFVGGDSMAVLGDQAFRQAATDTGVLVAVDDEGGRVQRLDLVAGQLPSARTLAATLDAAAISAAAEKRVGAMRQLGINVDFAPVVDVTTQADDDVIGDRSFGSDPEAVTRNAGAFAMGLRKANVLPVLKHFPGHGRSSGDSHDGAVLVPALDDLRRSDLVPFQRLTAEEPIAVMVGHLDVPGLTEDGLPSSLSPNTYRLLREEIAFGGLTFTDDLAGMAAVGDRFSPPAAAEAAIGAGADVALLSSTLDPTKTIDRLVEAVELGRIRQIRVDAAWKRVVEMKVALGARSCPPTGGTSSGP